MLKSVSIIFRRKVFRYLLGVVASTILVSCGGGGGPKSYAVSASAGVGGSVSPTSASVTEGSTASISVTTNEGYEIDSVSGCGGTLSGTVYTTGPITGACSVTASFKLKKYTVSIGTAEGGSVSPSTAVVEHGKTAVFSLTPTNGYSLVSVTGCGGTLSGDKYTTGPVTAACTIQPT